MTDPLRQGKHWDQQFEEGFPDCRLSWSRRHDHDNMIRIGRLDFEKVYCANCGGPGGAVTAMFAAHVFFICDNCVVRNGEPQGARRISEAEEAAARKA